MLNELFESKNESQSSDMTVAKEFMFPTILRIIKMRNWEEKKMKLINLFESNQHQFERHSGDLLLSDYQSRENYDEMAKSVEYILSDEMSFLRNDIDGCEDLHMKFVWFQHYIKGSYHMMHNHGSLGYSGICFIKFNPDEHELPVFVSSHNDYMFDYLVDYIPKNVTEGTTLIFPSAINHYIPPNKSSEERLILSFNLRLPWQS